MTTIMATFEHMMNEKRRAQALKRAEDDRKRRDERGGWPGTLNLSAEHDAAPLRPHDRLLRPDVLRTRSSSVIAEPRPTFHRSRSGSVAAGADALPGNIPVDPLAFETGLKFNENPPRARRSRPSRGSRGSFEFPPANEEDQRPAYEQPRADELKREYLATARRHFHEELHAGGDARDAHRDDVPRSEKPRRRDQDRKPREQPADTEPDFHRIHEETQRQRATPTPPNGSAKDAHLHRVKSTDHVPLSANTTGNSSIEEEVLKLEREQAALALRISELRAAAEAAATIKTVQTDADRGRERERDQKTKAAAEPKVKVEARKQQNTEGGVFKAMQDRLRKVEDHKSPEKPEFVRKAKRAATMPFLDQEIVNATGARQTPNMGDSDSAEGRVHFSPATPTAEQARPPIPRVRTPGPKAATPARVRTPSPRSQSPVRHSSNSSIASSNATRDTSPGHEAASSVHEAVTLEPVPKVLLAPTAPFVPRPAGRPREAGLSAAPNPERPKSAAPTTGLNVPPHVNTSSSPIEVNHEQEPSPMNAKTPRASAFDPERTPRAPACPVPEADDKADPSPSRVYLSPSQTRARGEEDPSKRRVDEEASKRRVDAAFGATVAAAAAEMFDRAGGKKRSKDAELQAQEEKRAADEQLAKERRRIEEERRAREQRAEDARLREAAEKRERDERARMDRERRDRERERERLEQEERKRRWGPPTYEPAPRNPVRSETSVIDAWNSYELRWSALGVASSTQPITFRNIPWPLMRIPSGPESITPQAVGAFLLSPLHSQDKSRKERLRGAMLRWHSDKFEGRWMARIDESERLKVKEAVGAVARCLTELLTKPDLY
jgi:hypothetical protein